MEKYPFTGVHPQRALVYFSLFIINFRLYCFLLLKTTITHTYTLQTCNLTTQKYLVLEDIGSSNPAMRRELCLRDADGDADTDAADTILRAN